MKNGKTRLMINTKAIDKGFVKHGTEIFQGDELSATNFKFA